MSKNFSTRRNPISSYWPLFCLILIAALGAMALSYRSLSLKENGMPYFMGLFLCQFAMLKLFHPTGFADGFQKYDLIASRSRFYAYLYPFLELSLGLGYLSGFNLRAVSIATVVILGIGAIGVMRALAKGLDVRCSCMGTVLDVPLSTVTLTEDISMVLMALLLLFSSRT